MYHFGCNDLTQLGGNLRNIIIMSGNSDTYRSNLLVSYDITKGKLLQYSISFLFDYLLFPAHSIMVDIFYQLCDGNILSKIK